MEEENIMDQLQQHAREGTQSPLFEPERSQSDVPLPSKTATSSSISSHIAKLQAIEVDARAALASWNANTGSTLPAKRPASEVLTDSDDSDDEKDASEVPPFDPAQRRRPKLPLYHPGFQQAERDVKSILEVFKDFLNDAANSGAGGEEAEYLQKQVFKNRNIAYQEEIRFAVTGDTGSGKSATTNALLGDDLTPEGDSGSACTNVVTEFRQKKLTTNIGAVQAEVQFYCREYCVNLVTTWFKEWFSIRQRTIHEEDEVDDHERARKDAALECMNHLFAHRTTPDSLENFMSSSKSLDENSVLNKLIKWTIEIHDQFIVEGDLCVYLTSSTHNDMREQLRPFRMRASNARFRGKPLSFSPWPFVEIIRYYIDSPLLQDGICLADVPGAKDVNMYRVTSAEAYLQQCEKTIVVVDIKRAASDQSFRQHYLDAHRRRHHGSVILVATRSDEINDDGSSTLQLDTIAEKQLAPIEEKLNERNDELQSISNDLEAKKREIKQIKVMIQQGNASERPRYEALLETKKDMMARKKTLVSLIASLEKDCKGIRIACRNRIVARDLNRMYSQNTGDDTGLCVSFCVSNRMYMRHRRGYNSSNPDRVPSTKLEDTQIPDLFNHISGQPSQGKVAVLEHFIQFKIPMLLSIFQMSCSKSTEARVDHITKILDQAIEDLRLKINKMERRCHDTFLKDIVTTLSCPELQDTFDRCAERALEKLARMNAASHRAVVKKKGIYQQKKRNINVDLNKTLLSSVIPTMESVFRNAVEEAPKSFKAHAAQTVRSGINDLNKILKDDPQALAGDAYQLCFGNHLVGYDKNVGLKVEAATKKLRQGLIEVGNNASKFTEKGYFYQAMVPIYEQAEAERPQKRQRLIDVRHNYLVEKIPGLEGPFSEISERAEKDGKEVINDTCSELLTSAISILEEIREAFERQKHRKENDTPEGQRFRKELHDLVAEALRILKGVVTESLEKCKDYK